MDRNIPGLADIQHHFGAAAVEEWSVLLRHFEWGEGFACLILLVPDQHAAKLCANALRQFVSPRPVVEVPLIAPGDLYRLPERLLLDPTSTTAAAIWVAAAIPVVDDEYPAWRDAWVEAARRLNERRDVLRSRFVQPLLLVGAPWLVPLLREQAPDLWSIRKLVVHIEAWSEALPHELAIATVQPKRARPVGLEGILGAAHALLAAQVSVFPQCPSSWAERPFGPDPELALRAAGALRNSLAHRPQLAEALLQVSWSFACRHRGDEVDRAAQEALMLLAEDENSKPPSIARAYSLRAYGRLQQHDAAAALNFARQATIADHSPTSLQDRMAALEVAMQAAALLQRPDEVQEASQLLIALADPAQGTAEGRCELAYREGLGQMLQKHNEAAEVAFRRALSIAATAKLNLLRWANLHLSLADALRGQWRFHEALSSVQQALYLCEQGKADSSSMGNVLSTLGNDLWVLGRLQEACDAFECAIPLLSQGNDVRSQFQNFERILRAQLLLRQEAKAVSTALTTVSLCLRNESTLDRLETMRVLINRFTFFGNQRLSQKFAAMIPQTFGADANELINDLEKVNREIEAELPALEIPSWLRLRLRPMVPTALRAIAISGLRAHDLAPGLMRPLFRYIDKSVTKKKS